MVSLERVAIFIDVENLRHSFDDNLQLNDKDKKGYFWGLHHPRLWDGISKGREITCIRYYDALPDDERRSARKKRLLEDLEKDPKVQVRLGKMRKEGLGGNPKQKGVDILLATDMLGLGLIGFYNRAILVANDSDYIPAIQYVREITGKPVEAVLMRRRDRKTWKLEVRYFEIQKITVASEITQRFLQECFSQQLWLKYHT